MDRKHPPRKPPEFIGILLLILFCIQPTGVAQNDTSTNPSLVLTAAKLTGTPSHIDRKRIHDQTQPLAELA